MTLLSEKDHAHLLKDPALTLFSAEGRLQTVFPYRFGAVAQTQPPRRDAQTAVRQGQASMNGAPVVQQLAVASLNGHHQIKTMAPLGSQMRISSNGSMRPPAVPATNLQINGSTHHVSLPQPIHIPVSQHLPASPAAIVMPHVDAQKPEVVVTATTSNPAIPAPQLDISAELTLNGLLDRPKTQNSTPHGGPTHGFHLPPPASAFSQNQPHAGGLSLQQMQNLKTAFASIPAPDLAAVGRVISASYMNLAAANGTNVNMQLPAGANMKVSPARQIQRAINPASFQRPTSAVNGTDGQLNNGSTVTAGSMGNAISSSPAALRSPSANHSRTPSRSGAHVNGQHSLTPHAQPTSSPLLNNNGTQVQRSSMAGMPSSSLQQQQQAVKANQNSF